ncbi:MAG: hypothetical protein PHF86_09400 [Candidatus Nanoarchaeia archaeon]|nr:hypothetical protein [Candidatus Nanoarchaeia archaeon]
MIQEQIKKVNFGRDNLVQKLIIVQEECNKCHKPLKFSDLYQTNITVSINNLPEGFVFYYCKFCDQIVCYFEI